MPPVRRSFRGQLVALLVASALAPLVALGLFSMLVARRALVAEVSRANLGAARGAAREIAAHLGSFESLLVGLAAACAPGVRLERAQLERVLRNHHLDLPAFREIDLVGPDGVELARGGIERGLRDRRAEPAVRAALAGRSYRSPMRLTADLEPLITVSTPVFTSGRPAGAIVASVEIAEVWRIIDRIRIGAHGVARVLEADGRLIAHGEAREKLGIFDQRRERDLPILARLLHGGEAVERYRLRGGEELLGAAARVPGVGWTVVIEQPVREAFAAGRWLERSLAILAVLFVALAALVGAVGGGRVVAAVRRLRARAEEVGRNQLEGEVALAPSAPRELHELAASMDRMARDLGALQGELRLAERATALGRFAAGLAHHLKHPVVNARARLGLLAADGVSEEERRAAAAAILEQLQLLARTIDDLKAIAHTGALDLVSVALDLNAVVSKHGTRLRGLAARVEVAVEPCGEPAHALGNALYLDRVLENLAANALDAMPEGGRLTLAVAPSPEPTIRIVDTGVGIEPARLPGLFREFESTKRAGFGIGLAFSRRVIDAMGGRIDVQSELGRGTTFSVVLPRAREGGRVGGAP